MATSEASSISALLFIAAIMMSRLGEHLKQIARFLCDHHHGLVLLTGPMRAGKSAILLMILEILSNPSGVLCVKPLRENRSSGLKSRTGASASAYAVTSSEELTALIAQQNPRVVIIDEAQFFDDPAIYETILEIAQRSLVIVASLDLDFRAEEFPAFTKLNTEGARRLGDSFLLIPLTGVCQECDAGHATHSRLVTTPPLDGVVLVGDLQYRTVCKNCHAPPPTS